MTTSTFFKELAIVSALGVLGVWSLQFVEKLAIYQDFGWMSLVFFLVLTLLMFLMGKRASGHKNPNTFTSVIMGFTMLKVLLSIGIIFLYRELIEPPTKWFVLPFFALYILYTAYESYVMMRLGRKT